MRTFPLTIAAGGEEKITRAGNYIRTMEATGLIMVRVDGGPLFELPQGVGVPIPGGFSQISVFSPSAQTVKIAVADLRVDDSRLSLSAAVTIANGATIINAAATVSGAAVLLAAADADRKALSIYNNSTDKTLYIGAAGVTVANGWPIPPKGGYVVDKAPEAAVYAIASGINTDVRTIAEKV